MLFVQRSGKVLRFVSMKNRLGFSRKFQGSNETQAGVGLTLGSCGSGLVFRFNISNVAIFLRSISGGGNP